MSLTNKNQGAPGRTVQTRAAQPLLAGSATILYGGAPTGNTAMSFDGTTGSYMTLGSSTPTNINQTTSNIFVEAWVYFNDLNIENRVFNRALNTGTASSVDIVFRTAGASTGFPSYMMFNYGSGGFAGAATASGLTTGTWIHVAMSSRVGGSSYVFVNGNPGTGFSPSVGTYNSNYTTFIGVGGSVYANMYVRDLRVIRGGIVPIATFTPQAATWAYGSVPSYVTGGTNVLGLAAQYMTPTTTTGTPLFSQLSPSAVASSVGAFSLRAVNGTSVKAVQVRNGTTSATQDFYADRLGNLLTAPVTGQSLANWLGGATGYVTTWYDQSGKGNDATQATAANQPVIQGATKGPGYMVNFNGTSQFVTLSASYDFLNNTNFTLNTVALRTATKAGTNFIFGTNSATVNFQRLAIGFASDTQTAPLGNFTSVTGTEKIIPAYSASDPVYYITGTVSPSRTGYTNDVVNGTNTNTGLATVPVGTTFSIGRGLSGGTWYYQGNLFELLIFTSALDQTQVTQVYQNQLSYTGT